MALLPRLARGAGVGGRVTALVAVALPLGAQPASPRAIPATYAITNARIVPVSGATIEKGTIVVRNGLIAAVGASVPVPADARVVDAAGLTVYPGLIDAYSSTGLGAPPAPATGGRGGAASRSPRSPRTSRGGRTRRRRATRRTPPGSAPR